MRNREYRLFIRVTAEERHRIAWMSCSARSISCASQKRSSCLFFIALAMMSKKLRLNLSL